MSQALHKKEKNMETSREVPNVVKQAALNWLNLIDRKKYTQAYSLTSPYFKERVKEVNWLNKIESALQMDAPVSERKLINSKYLTSMPDAPDGEYYVMQFSSERADNTEVIETITPVLDNGQWKVCGYYIK
jgi:hypothetical protein